MTAEELDAYVERIVAHAPPLTTVQENRLAVLLRPAVDEARAA